MTQDLSTEARGAKADRLDRAIDQVAARLTRVDDNDALASQIINALPERVTWFGWLFHSWAPRLAMIGVVVVASGIIWGNRGKVNTPGASPLASSQLIAAPTALVASVREAEPRTMPLAPLEPLEPLEPLDERADHERSLSALEAVSALALEPLAPVSLPEDAPLTLAPLAITDLPLAPESISPR